MGAGTSSIARSEEGLAFGMVERYRSDGCRDARRPANSCVLMGIPSREPRPRILPRALLSFTSMAVLGTPFGTLLIIAWPTAFMLDQPGRLDANAPARR